MWSTLLRCEEWHGSIAFMRGRAMEDTWARITKASNCGVTKKESHKELDVSAIALS